MMSKRRYGLRLKIVLSLLIPLFVVDTVGSYLRYESYQRILLQNLELRAKQTEESVSIYLHDGVVAQDWPVVQGLLDRFAQQEGLLAACVLDDQGRARVCTGDGAPAKMTASLTTAGLASTADSTVGTVVVTHGGNRAYRRASPIAQDERGTPALEPAGMLVADFSMAPVEEWLSGYLQSRLLLSLGGAGLVVLCTYLLMSRVVTSRLRQLLGAIGQISAGNLHIRLPILPSDEIGDLAQAINYMTDDLLDKRRLEDAVVRHAGQLQVQAERLSALRSLADAVCQSLDLQDILSTGLRKVLGLVEAQGGWILLRGGAGTSSDAMVSHGLPTDIAVGHVECVWLRLLDSEVFASGRSVLISSSQCPVRSYLEEGPGPVAGERGILCPVADYMLAAGLSVIICVPLRSKGQIVGVMTLMRSRHGPTEELSQDTLDLLTAVGQELGIAIENASLYDELRQEAAVHRQLLDRLIGVQEEERKRIARELHDRAGQSLTSLMMMLGMLREADSFDQVRAHAERLQDEVHGVLKEMRALALELRPTMLDELGLLPALRQYVRRFTAKFRLPVDLEAVGLDTERLPSEFETCIYRIAQEALTNVVRHADARTVSVLLEGHGASVRLIVEDDGKGFDVGRTMRRGPTKENLGLYGMRERATLLGGWMTIESTPGKGTAVFVELPLASDGGQHEQDRCTSS